MTCLIKLKSSTLQPIRVTSPTRSSNKANIKFVIPKCKTTTFQRSFFIRSTMTWITLADELKYYNNTENTISSLKITITKFWFHKHGRTLKDECHGHALRACIIIFIREVYNK